MNINIRQIQLSLGISAVIGGIGLVVLLGISFSGSPRTVAHTEAPTLHASAEDGQTPQMHVEIPALPTPPPSEPKPMKGHSIILRVEGGEGHSSTGTLSIAKFPTWVETYRTIVGTDAERINVSAVKDSLIAGDIHQLPLMQSSTVLSTESDSKNVLRATTDQTAHVGFVYDPQSVASTIADALMDGKQDVTIYATYEKPTVTMTKPDGSTDTLELLATAYSDFDNSTPGRDHNVHKVINERLNNVVVPNGTIYSHVAMIDAPITLAKGWKEDLGLFGGGAALTPGAGICQSSTTLYRAVLLAGLPIVEFKSHSLFVDHYEFFGIGLDATVFPGTHDFRFRNDTGDDLVIQAYINYPTVTLNIFGKPTGRTVKMKGPYFAGSKNRPAALPPLSTHQIGWVREITYPDGKVTDEKRISTYAKPLWHSLTKKYIGADGAKLLVTK